MTATMAHMSMLPAITCSNCGADVDLAMMGDHVCATQRADVPPIPSLYDKLPMSQPESPYSQEHSAPALPVQTQSPLATALATKPNNVVVTTPSGGHRMHLGPVGTAIPPRNPSPIIPADADNKTATNPFPPSTTDLAISAPTTPHATSDSPPIESTNPYFWQSPSQAASVDDLNASPAATSPASAPAASIFESTSPYSPVIPSPLSAPEPLADRPDSAAMFQQFARSDSLVPPPPPARSSARPKPAPAPLHLSAERARDESQLAPLSPVPNGAHVIRRMDTIMPGPFDSRHKKSDSKDTGNKGFNLFRRKSSKKKKASISGPIAISDAPPMPTAEPSLFVGGNMDIAGPVEQHSSSPKLDNFGQPLPSGPAPPRPARPGGVDTLLETLQSANADTADDHEIHGHFWDSPREGDEPHSGQSDQTLKSPRDQGSAAVGNIGRPTSDSSIYSVVPSSDRMTTFGHELPQIREDEDREAESEADADAPPAWPTGRLRSASRSAEGAKPRLDAVPPLPNIHGSEDPVLAQQRLHHTPTDSASSQDFGSVSDGRRESSRSSPPTSTASSFSPSKQSMDDQREMHNLAGETLSSAAFNRAANFSRPRAPTEGSATSPPKTFVEPASPPPKVDLDATKPEGVRGVPGAGSPKLGVPPPRKASLASLQPPPRSTSRAPQYAGPGTFSDAPPSPMFPTSPRFPPPPPIPATERRVNPSRKGSGAAKSCCRGCDLPIEGKSVKASDGRLTGRYHRECFVCKACKERFPTADFYILDDHPYCAQHYHELNGSICVDCSRGIEGRYIDTTGDRKHHIYCFTCSDCSKPLSQDYFEIDGKFYCEADAGKVHQKSSVLTPGRKFPERRTTRLMMM